MIDEDDIPDDVKRGVEKALFGSRPRSTVVGSTRRYAHDRKPGETQREWLERKRREATTKKERE